MLVLGGGSTVDPSKYRNVEGSAGCGRELSLPGSFFSLGVCGRGGRCVRQPRDVLGGSFRRALV